jgi:hypothetical protein
MTLLCICILACWFLISALAQLNVPGVRFLKARDALSLIPNWSFFAPRPGTFDYHLLFRDAGPPGQFSPWEDIPLADQRSLLGAIWNPQKRSKKVLSDVVQSLVRLAQDRTMRDFSLTIPYLAILNYVSSGPHQSAASHTQFMILRSDGFFSRKDPEFLFCSSTHAL